MGEGGGGAEALVKRFCRKLWLSWIVMVIAEVIDCVYVCAQPRTNGRKCGCSYCRRDIYYQALLISCNQTSCSSLAEYVHAPSILRISSTLVNAIARATNHLIPSMHGGLVKLPLYVQNSLTLSTPSNTSAIFIDTSDTTSGRSRVDEAFAGGRSWVGLPPRPVTKGTMGGSCSRKGMFFIPGSRRMARTARSSPVRLMWTRCISALLLSPPTEWSAGAWMCQPFK